jgi:hypothetical protein
MKILRLEVFREVPMETAGLDIDCQSKILIARRKASKNIRKAQFLSNEKNAEKMT